MEEQFATFHDIEHNPLRVYNRVVTSFNISTDFGQDALEKYYANFTNHEKWEMMCMMQYITQKGVEAAREFAVKDLELEDVQ